MKSRSQNFHGADLGGGMNQTFNHQNHKTAFSGSDVFGVWRTMKVTMSDRLRKYGLHSGGGDLLPTSQNHQGGFGRRPSIFRVAESTAANLYSSVFGGSSLSLDRLKKADYPPAAVQVSWLVLLVGFVVILSGILNIRDYSNHSMLSCGATACTFTEYGTADANNPTLPQIFEFNRVDYERTNAVRTKNGEITPVGGLKRRQLRKLGYSYSVSYKDMTEDGSGGAMKEILLSRGNLGKRAARERMTHLTNKMKSKEMTGEFLVKEGLGWSVSGCVRVMAGIMLCCLISLIGEFTTEGFNERYEEGRGSGRYKSK